MLIRNLSVLSGATALADGKKKVGFIGAIRNGWDSNRRVVKAAEKLKCKSFLKKKQTPIAKIKSNLKGKWRYQRAWRMVTMCNGKDDQYSEIMSDIAAILKSDYPIKTIIARNAARAFGTQVDDPYGELGFSDEKLVTLSDNPGSAGYKELTAN